MAAQQRSAEVKADSKNRPGVRPVAGEELTSDLDRLAWLPDDATRSQAARLGEARLPTVQRQALATQIGRLQGNRRLQRMVASLKQRGRTAVVQRNGGPATVTEAPLGTVTKVCLFRLSGPSGAYIENARQYILNTLGVPATDLIWVDSLAHLFTSLGALRGGPRVNRLIIVSHGREFEYTNVAVSDEGQVRQEAGWITPADVSQAAGTANARVVRDEVLAPGAIIEFWGCRIGRSITALRAWGQATLPGQGAEFRAPAERMGFDIYDVPEFYRQVGSDDEARRVRITNIDDPNQVRTDRQRAGIRHQLLGIYPQMVANREIVETTPARNPDQRFEYMRDLYNRSRGEIRTMRLTAESGENVAPGAAEWPSLWQMQQVNVADLWLE